MTKLRYNITRPIRLDLGLEAVERRRRRGAVNEVFPLRQQRKYFQVNRGRMMNDVAIIAEVVRDLPGHAKIVKPDIRELHQSPKSVGGEIVSRLQRRW